ncbi:hypothetical protein RV03_GL001845 [Enterococcus gallinarum]|nr:hypothetical protein RV03_GL001845 [Enterococcus gallinarum]
MYGRWQETNQNKNKKTEVLTALPWSFELSLEIKYTINEMKNAP